MNVKRITKECGWGKHQDCAATTSGKHSEWCGCTCHKEAERQAKEAATQTFINSHGGVVATTQGTRYQRGELAIITGKNESDRVLVCARCEYVAPDYESNEDGGYYADFCEPTAEEQQSAEYQKLQARIEADARHESHVTEQAHLAAKEDGWDDVDWDMSLACNAGHHDNCSGKNCTCECHKRAQMRAQASGSALVAPMPEVRVVSVAAPAVTRKRVTPLPDGYHVEQAPSGRWFVCLPDGSFLANSKTGYARGYAHKSSATRAARREVARHA